MGGSVRYVRDRWSLEPKVRSPKSGDGDGGGRSLVLPADDVKIAGEGTNRKRGDVDDSPKETLHTTCNALSAPCFNDEDGDHGGALCLPKPAMPPPDGCKLAKRKTKPSWEGWARKHPPGPWHSTSYQTESRSSASFCHSLHRTKGNKDAKNAKTGLEGTAKSTRHHASQSPRTRGRGALRRFSGQGTVGAGARNARRLNETEDAIKGKSSHEQGPQRG
ncbi:hypothetical protein EDB80DRAFT_442155 [Ilyonectria destructans]|nr:hypothetical protein EDB80DRAFT_442155 [Ilyonectria destructans]